METDLTNCDREPIRTPGAIQPHGALVAIDEASWLITNASSNLSDFFGVSPVEALGRPFSALINEVDHVRVLEAIASIIEDDAHSYAFTVHPHGGVEEFDAIAHRASGKVIVEFEAMRQPAAWSMADLYRVTQGAITSLRRASSADEAYRICVGRIREIAGFDRVMIYRFDDEWNGRVIAEAMRPDLEPFLGLQYPASDIPKQARELYMQNWLRFIADRDYVPVPILPPSGPSADSPLDMSQAILRSVSPIHLEYLRNMGVRASMSISLLKGDQLWGLVACHHYTSHRYLSYEARTACELLGQVMSMQFGTREDMELSRDGDRMNAIRATLTYRLDSIEDVGLALTEMAPTVQDLLPSTGAAVILDGQVSRIGLTPAIEEILQISSWLAGRDSSGVFVTDNLKGAIKLDSIGAVAAGLISASIGKSGRDRIIWFRPEQVREVNWAGDPSKSVEKGEAGVQLSPRGSFALWKQEVRGRCRPWSTAEVAVASEFRRDMSEVLISRASDLVKRNRMLTLGGAEKEEMLASERAARGEAERLNRMKDEFVATLSHELRTPLNSIVGWARILRRSGNVTDVKEASEVIERNARIQVAMIDDLLDVSRITAGKMRLDMQPMRLAVAVGAALDTVAPMAQTKGVRVERFFDPLDDIEITGDPNRLQQVFWNLLSNAVKFTPKSGKVQVVIERVDSHVEVSISDTGRGISPAFMPHIFDRFRQQDAATNRSHGGLGLGLSIVRHLVEMHGGTIFAKSGGEGQGSDFVVTLPLRAVTRARHRTGEHPTYANGVIEDDPLDLANIRILVVDDEEDSREMLRRILQECGAIVSPAGSAEDALEIYRRGEFEVIVSDIGMPGTDGYEFIRGVRQHEVSSGWKRCPAVALTAYARPEDRRRVLLAGFQIHVAKPVEPAEITAVIASLAREL